MLEPSSTLWSIGVVSFYGSAEAGEQPSGVRSERVGQIVDAVDALRSCRSDRFGREREVAPVVQMIERRHRQQDVQSERHCVPGAGVVQSGEVAMHIDGGVAAAQHRERAYATVSQRETGPGGRNIQITSRADGQ